MLTGSMIRNRCIHSAGIISTEKSNLIVSERKPENAMIVRSSRMIIKICDTLLVIIYYKNQIHLQNYLRFLFFPPDAFLTAFFLAFISSISSLGHTNPSVVSGICLTILSSSPAITQNNGDTIAIENVKKE